MTAAQSDAPESEAVRGRHVLIVGINYAPEPTGIAPYTTQIAEHMARSAASVTVLCGPPSYPMWRVSSDYRGWRRRERINGVDVIRLWHYVPSKQTGARRAAYEVSFGAHVAALRLLRSPDLVYAVVPSLLGAAAAVGIARRSRAPLVVHVQDLMARAAVQSGMTGGGRMAAAAEVMERYVFRNADRSVIVAEPFRAAVEDLGARAGSVVHMPNWTHIGRPSSPRDEVRSRLGWPPEAVVALHTGNMGWKQGLENVVEAARGSASHPYLRWVLMGDGSQRLELEQRATGLGNVSFLAPCPNEDYPDVLAAADVLLLNERPSIGEMSLPSKLTSYASTGLPIVAAVPATSPAGQEIAKEASGLLVPPGEPSALIRAVLRAAASSADPRSHSSWPGRPVHRETWERQLEKVLTATMA